MGDTAFAKTHLQEHLTGLLVSPVSEGFWSIYNSANELCERNGQPDQVLRTFQNMLTRIPEWSDSTLSTEVERILKVSKCSYMDDLLMGVFLAYMKAFASIRYRGTSNEIKIDFERPSLSKFIHTLYISAARELWQVAFLFKTSQFPTEIEARNRQEINNRIKLMVDTVISSFIPWGAIAKQYFVEEPETTPELPTFAEEKKGAVQFEEEDDDEDSEEEEQPKIHLSDETAELQYENLDEEAPTPAPPQISEQVELEPSGELVLNL